MRLATLLREIERSAGVVTVGELARRLGAAPAEVRAMLAALRASGRLGPEGGRRPGTAECATSGSCGVSCLGPAVCPFVVDLGGFLEVKGGH